MNETNEHGTEHGTGDGTGHGAGQGTEQGAAAVTLHSFGPEQLTPEVAREVHALAGRAEAHDGVAPLSEQFLAGLSDARLGHSHVVALAGAEIVGTEIAGAAAVAGGEAEFFVAPAWRQRGVGAQIYKELVNQGVESFWAHGNLAGARALAAANSLEAGRRLLVMEVGGDDLRASAQVPYEKLSAEGYEVLNLADSVERWGKQFVESAWLEANNQAFSWHPEQGGWDIDRLHRGMEAAWFDPQDVLFLWRTDSETTDNIQPDLAGFHWTKWHAEETDEFGEVYVVGLADAFRGRGLGGPVLNIGLERLAEKAAQRVILYVEADNKAAVRVYEKYGFKTIEEHCVYLLKAR